MIKLLGVSAWRNWQGDRQLLHVSVDVQGGPLSSLPITVRNLLTGSVVSGRVKFVYDLEQGHPERGQRYKGELLLLWEAGTRVRIGLNGGPEYLDTAIMEVS